MTKSLAKELREVPNFTNVYVTNTGEPIVWRALPDGTLTPQHVKRHYSGYYVATLRDDNGQKQSVQLGRLVLMAFCPDTYFPGAECDHIDRNPLNNRLDNLRWVTHRENCQNRANVEKQRDRALYLIYDDCTVAWYGRRKHTNIPSPTLSRILSGKHSAKYRCRGFYWDQLMQQPADVRKRVIQKEILDMIF